MATLRLRTTVRHRVSNKIERPADSIHLRSFSASVLDSIVLLTPLRHGAKISGAQRNSHPNTRDSTMTALADLDKKLWKDLKKDAKIKSSGWFKKADASVGKHIAALNKSREKFESSKMAGDLLKYQAALNALADAFDAFSSKKGLDDLQDGADIKKEALRNQIEDWRRDIAAEKNLINTEIAKLKQAAGPNLEKLDELEAQKRIEFWNKSKLPWQF
jgi:hypothetical protein